MRGGSQAHLLRADDGNLYIIKFQNNPQHVKVLANEFVLTTAIALMDRNGPSLTCRCMESFTGTRFTKV
jgi:hypothetical protein